MNGPEKKVVILALLLFLLGALVKFSPWDPVPQIEEFSYAEAVRENLSAGGPSEISAPAERKTVPKTAAVKKPKSKKSKASVRFPVSINRASAAELCAIKGVGPKLAERIIAYRTLHGGFSGPADLKKVSGIGKKKAETILTFIVFD